MAMRLSPESMVKAASGINRLIDKIPYQTQQSIKGVFYLFIFGFAVAGSVYGVMKGKSAAIIKSTPIIENTNDAFDLDIKRERGDGNFSSMLDSEMINEIKAKDMSKTTYPSRVNLEPEVDRGIIEPDAQKKIRPAPDMQVGEPIVEGENRSKPRIDASVRPLERRGKPLEGEHDTIIKPEKKELEPLQDKRSNVRERRPEKSDRLPGEKNRERGRDIRSPEPPNSEGIIEN